MNAEEEARTFYRRWRARSRSRSPCLLSQEEQKAESRRTRELGELLRYLHRCRWDVYATPTFKYAVDADEALDQVRGFIERFGPQAYGFITVERGRHGELRNHPHSLIGGLNAIMKSRGGRLWKHGDVLWEPYTPKRGGVLYMVKGYAAEDGFRCDLVGEPKRVRRREWKKAATARRRAVITAARANEEADRRDFTGRRER